MGLIEVLAIGTAIKRNEAVSTNTQQLMPQAIIRDRDTFFDESFSDLRRDHKSQPAKPNPMQGNSPVASCFAGCGCLVFALVGLVFFIAAIANG